MAESIVNALKSKTVDYDFIAFYFNGKHSYEDFGIYRVSDGNRYVENLTPQIKNITAESQRDGVYFFGSYHKERMFEIKFAFDRLTEVKIRELRVWLNGKEQGNLWFSENPYKTYLAKVTGQPVLKFIPFDEIVNGNITRLYKGEGTVQFTCYYPYAHTPNSTQIMGGGKKNIVTVAETYLENATSTAYVHQQAEKQEFSCGVMIESTGWSFYIPVTSENHPLIKEIRINYYINGKREQIKEDYTNKDSCDSEFTPTFKANGHIYVESIEYIFKRSILKKYMAPTETEKYIDYYISNGTVSYKYSQTDSNEDYCYRNIEKVYSGKCFNDYASYYYPTKKDWYEATNMPLHNDSTINIGDLPVNFKVIYTTRANDDNVTLTVGSASVTIENITKNQYSNIIWDSRTGIVSAKINNTEKQKAIPYLGVAYTNIPVNGSTSVSTTGQGKATIEYDL